MKKLLIGILTTALTLSIGTATASAAGTSGRQTLTAANSRYTCHYLESNCHFINVGTDNIRNYFQSGHHFFTRNVDGICGYIKANCHFSEYSNESSYNTPAADCPTDNGSCDYPVSNYPYTGNSGSCYNTDTNTCPQQSTGHRRGHHGGHH